MYLFVDEVHFRNFFYDTELSGTLDRKNIYYGRNTSYTFMRLQVFVASG